MTLRNLKLTFILGAVFFGGSAAGEEPTSKAQERMDRLQEKYTFTGELKNCVPIHSLRESRVIDNQTIFFRGPGKTAYLNKLPRTCSRLAAEERFAYKTSIGRLCHLDVITVVDSYGRSWSRCGLGKFEELRSKPSSDSDTDKG